MIDDDLDLRQRVQIAMGTSTNLLSLGELDFAVSQAINELGFEFPISNHTREFWAVERGKRHAIDILRIQSAHRFKYKQLSLNDRFKHYDALISSLDKKFEEALNTDPELLNIPFSGILGYYIQNGFVYDRVGNDVTKQMNALVGD